MAGTRTQEQTATAVELDLPWNVVVHDDPVNLMGYVTRVFMQVFGYPEARAVRHMMEVHTHGRSVVWSGNRERAEFYVQRMHEHQLRATLERAS